MKYGRLKWDANTRTPGLVLKKDTLVEVLTQSEECFLVKTPAGESVFLDYADLRLVPTPQTPQTRYDRLAGPDEL